MGSDVWAFAVTVWEMFTHGKVPYTFTASECDVARSVVTGGRLERPMEPTECPEGVFAVMQRCWTARPADRPTFGEVKALMLAEFQREQQGKCCVCLQVMSLRSLMALVPCGHRCLCPEHATQIVGRACPICKTRSFHAVRVFD